MAKGKDFMELHGKKNIYADDLSSSQNGKWGLHPPKINIDPENDGLEDVSPFPGVEHLRFHKERTLERWTPTTSRNRVIAPGSK